MLRFGLFIAIFGQLIGCGADRHAPPHEPAVTPVPEMHAAAVARLPAFLENGQVVSRWENGEAEHLGDSLLWTGIAIGSLDCETGWPLMDAMYQRMARTDGELDRFDPLPERYAGNEISFDGETGFYYAVARRLRRCPEESASLAVLWGQRLGYIDRHGGRLHRNVAVEMTTPFDFTRDAISHALGLRGEPHVDRLRSLEVAAYSWIQSVVAAKAAAYRIHLAIRHLMTVQALGHQLSEQGYRNICNAAKPAALPLVEWWCGRHDEFLTEFRYDAFEYRHQRAIWESPDGKEGLRTPAVDLLDYLSQRYGL